MTNFAESCNLAMMEIYVRRFKQAIENRLLFQPIVLVGLKIAISPLFIYNGTAI
jgi:hypothetical protein